MPKVLLLEDEYMLSSSIKLFLEDKSYEVFDFENGQDALRTAKTQKFDLYILDINTPGVKGLEVLKYVRQKGLTTPIIIISAHQDIHYIERAYGLGCNEYIKKPFALRELEIRINNLLTPSNDISNLKLIRLSDSYIYNMQTDTLTYNDKPVKLPKKQHYFVKLLVQNIDSIVKQEDICKYIWGDASVDDSTIRSLVNRTRTLLKEDLIDTHKGLGYQIKKA